SSAACFHRDTAYPSTDCAAAPASAESAKAYPELVSSGKTPIRAPATTARPNRPRLSPTVGSTARKRTEKWQPAIVVVAGTVVSQTTQLLQFKSIDCARVRDCRS